MKKFFIFLFSTLILISVIFIYLFLSSQKTSTLTPATKTNSSNNQSIKLMQEAGLTITTPLGFYFSEEKQMNYTTNKPYAISFTIQNYKNSINETKTPYQLYGLYQWDTPEINKDEFYKGDYMLLENTRKEFTVDGNPAISGTTKGERARFTIYILNKGHILTLAASETSEEQRDITDSIIKSIKFN